MPTLDGNLSDFENLVTLIQSGQYTAAATNQLDNIANGPVPTTGSDGFQDEPLQDWATPQGRPMHAPTNVGNVIVVYSPDSDSIATPASEDDSWLAIGVNLANGDGDVFDDSSKLLTPPDLPANIMVPFDADGDGNPCTLGVGPGSRWFPDDPVITFDESTEAIIISFFLCSADIGELIPPPVIGEIENFGIVYSQRFHTPTNFMTINLDPTTISIFPPPGSTCSQIAARGADGNTNFPNGRGNDDVEFLITKIDSQVLALYPADEYITQTRARLANLGAAVRLDASSDLSNEDSLYLFLQLNSDTGDCNCNLRSDRCEILNCNGEPACRDCNLNGIPDQCDLGNVLTPACPTNITSQDTNGDQVPDECVLVANAGSRWTDPIWGLGAGYPDLQSEPGLFVTIEDQNLLLDEDIEINGLSLLSSTLQTFEQGLTRDLTILTQNGMLIAGVLEVARNQVVAAPIGHIAVAFGGQYRKTALDSVTATTLLEAGELLISEGPIATPTTISLSDEMTMVIHGDFTIDGAAADTCDVDTKGNCTPPRAIITDQASVTIGGSLRLLSCTDLGCSSSQAVSLMGDFDNKSIYPDFVNLSSAIIRLSGATNQVFEVGGLDYCATSRGFGSNTSGNFSVGRIEVDGNASVAFVDRFHNSTPNLVDFEIDCLEALYVDVLILSEGSEVTLDRCRVYYNSLVDLGATITPIGCGELIPVTECADANVCTFDDCDNSWYPSACNHANVQYGDVNGGGAQPNLDDILCVLSGFARYINCPNADLANCTPNGVVNLDDILAVLSAFAGVDPCSCGS